MRANLLALGSLALFGCGGAQSSSTATATDCVEYSDTALQGGRCEVRVGDCCFTEQRAACAAAGCPDSCVLLESYPAQVRCEETAPAGQGGDPTCRACVAAGRNWTAGHCSDACLMDTYCIGPGNPAAGGNCALAVDSAESP